MIDGYGKQERVAVEKTCASLDAMVLQIMHIQSSMGENPAFSPVRSFSPTRAVSLLEELRKYHLGFYDMQILGLYYYEDSYIYLSSSTYRLDLFLDTYQYDALTKEQWRKALNKGEQIAIYPAANLTMQGLSLGRQILFCCHSITRDNIPVAWCSPHCRKARSCTYSVPDWVRRALC